MEAEDEAVSASNKACLNSKEPLSGCLLFVAAERQNEIRRGARGGGRGEYRFLVVLQDGEILRDILSVIGPRLVRYAKLRAKEHCGCFRDQLLERICAISEAFALFAIEATLGANPMG